MKSTVSIILPAYNEEKNILYAYNSLTTLFKDAEFDYRIIFVNDGSNDNTWEEIKKVAKDRHVMGICFSKNFGKESAISAGLQYFIGDAAVVMDCDMQHPPQVIFSMYNLWKQGYDVIQGIKLDRGKESGLHRVAANIFYMLISKATGIDMSNASDFKFMDKK